MNDFDVNGLSQVLPGMEIEEQTLSDKLKQFKKERLLKEFKRRNPTKKKEQLNKPLMQV